jgi:IS30 family transposase
MGSREYRHFSIEERCEIARHRQAGHSIRQIAAALDREPSSVARELKRNSAKKGYLPSYAGEQAQARRWKGSKLERKPQLQETVLGLLAKGVSPESVAGRLALEQGKKVISHETIYRFIFAQIVRTKDYTWRHYLPRGKAKRGFRGRKGGSSALHIEHRVPIAERPLLDRSIAGHWEADTMQFAKTGQAILALQERSTRLVWMQRLPSKAAASVAQRIQAALVSLPADLRRSITFDNGTEFAYHYTLRQPLAIQTYFCDPYSPWQKGGVENAIGRIRRRLPRKTDLTAFTASQIQQIATHYNHIPRKCLGYLTPAEAFSKLLHFKCESTPPPSRGRLLQTFPSGRKERPLCPSAGAAERTC